MVVYIWKFLLRWASGI